MLDFIKKHPELFTILGLLAFCGMIFFYGIGSYALMDVDETRYVSMARDMFHSKDYMTLYLNGVYFFEKPPLYFWGEVLSFLGFGVVNEFTARVPVALYGTLSTLLLYFVGKKVVSRRYGIVSALILATSVEFLILAKYAILDILLATCVEFAIMSGFLTYFVKEKNKKYCWWAFYFFSGLAVLAKGIPGFALPFGTMFFVAIFTKRFKELFRPQYLLVGFLIFFAVVLPWHILMLNKYDPLFFNEYVMKHHVHRFFDSSGVNRKQPFYFFALTILWGFCPWILSSLAILCSKIKKLKNINLKFNFEEFSNSQKYMFLNFISFALIFLFFSSSSTKLVTYIVPIYFTMANMLAFSWVKYLENGEYDKQINITTHVWFGILLVASIVAMFTQFFLPEKIYADIVSVKWFTIILLFVFGVIGILVTKLNKKYLVFATLVAFVTVLSAFGMGRYFNLDYKFGQNDLMKYGKYAIDNNLSIITINNPNRYSLNYYGPKKVKFGQYASIHDAFNDGDLKTVFIIRKNELKYYKEIPNYTTIFEGKKYLLIKP